MRRWIPLISLTNQPASLVSAKHGRLFDWEMRLRHSMDVSWSDLPLTHPKRMVDWRR